MIELENELSNRVSVAKANAMDELLTILRESMPSKEFKQTINDFIDTQNELIMLEEEKEQLEN